MGEMTLKEAIEVLKKVKHWIDYGAGELEPTANAVIEAIDTVVEHCEQKTYTAKDMETFAEWLSLKEYSYHPKAKMWTYGMANRKTTEQLRELWEQERGEK